MNVEKFDELVNKGDYLFEALLYGIEYYIPNDESYTIVVVDRKHGIVMDTHFFEMADFLPIMLDGKEIMSDYAYLYHDFGYKQVLCCKFELEDNFIDFHKEY